jgi:hypothetical protein
MATTVRTFSRAFSERMVNVEDEMYDEMANVDDKFVRLLNKFGVQDDAQIQRLVDGFDVSDKVAYLDFCVDVYERHEKFTNNDELMLRTLDNDHTVDCIRILALWHRIQHADHEWLESFCRCGGVSVLVETIDNCLSMAPKNVQALLKVIQCIHTVISKHSLEVVTSTRGAIHACVMSLDFKFAPLAVDVLELLNTFCLSPDLEASEEVYSALQLLSKKVDDPAQQPFSFLINAVRSDAAGIRFSALQFINRLMSQMNQLDKNSAMHFRLALTKAGLPAAIDAHRAGAAALVDEEMEDFVEPAIEEDKCRVPGCSVEMKADTSAVASVSIFSGMEDILPYTVSLDKDNLSFWSENAEHTEDDDQDQSQEAEHGPTGTRKPDFVVPVSSIKNIVEYCGDPELQANYDQIFRIDMSDGTKLCFPFGAGDELWETWITALPHAILRKKLELAVWPSQTPYATTPARAATPGISLVEPTTLWKKQVDLYDLLLRQEKINMTNFKGKKLFQYAYYVLDYNMCTILQQADPTAQADLMARNIEILTQLASIGLGKAPPPPPPPAPSVVDDGELRKVRAELAAANEHNAALQREKDHLSESLRISSAAAAANAADVDAAEASRTAMSQMNELKDNRIQSLQDENRKLLERLQAAAADHETRMQALQEETRQLQERLQTATAAASADAAAVSTPAAASPAQQAATPGVEESPVGGKNALSALFAKRANLGDSPTRPPAESTSSAAVAVTASDPAPAPAAASSDDGDELLNALSADMREKYAKYVRMAKSGVPPAAVRGKMQGDSFSPQYIDKVFAQANIAATPAEEATVDTSANVASKFPARKQHAADPTRQRTAVPVKKVPVVEAYKSTLWRNIAELDLNWEDVDSAFTTVVEAPAPGSEAAAGAAGNKRMSVRAPLQPAAEGVEAESGDSPVKAGSGGAGGGNLLAELAKKAKMLNAFAPSKVHKPFTAGVSQRYGAILDDIKQFKLVPFEALRSQLVSLSADLTVEKCAMLLRHSPTDEELEQLARPDGCSEEDRKENPVIQLFTMLSSIPRCKERIQFHLTVARNTEKLQDLVREMNTSIRNAQTGIELLNANRPHLTAFFSVVLSICNYLNVKQSAATAYALTLESMMKLITVRTRSTNKPPNYSVLHAVDEQMKKVKKPLFWKDGENWDAGSLALATAGANAVSNVYHNRFAGIG